MPKVIKTKTNYYLKDFPNEIYTSDETNLFCSCCEKALSTNQHFLVIQHISMSKHQQNED